MTRILLLVLVLALWGCGGGGGGGSSSNPFLGTFAGAWSSTTGDDGAIFFNVDQNGEIAGEVHSNDLAVDGSLLGLVEDNGDTSLTFTFDGEAPLATTGTMELSGNGGTLTGELEGNGQTITFSIVRQ